MHAAAIYAALAALPLLVALVRGTNPLTVEDPWVAFDAVTAHTVSLGAGLVIAVVTIAATRAMVRHFAWARALHHSLRPSVRHRPDSALVVLGLASAVGEELFFRGLLAVAIGLVASSIAFGLLHQVRGTGRWAWAAWATLMGLAFGATMFATGSLVGPLVAHAVINVANLRFLRDAQVTPPSERRLGGLLGRA